MEILSSLWCESCTSSKNKWKMLDKAKYSPSFNLGSFHRTVDRCRRLLSGYPIVARECQENAFVIPTNFCTILVGLGCVEDRKSEEDAYDDDSSYESYNRGREFVSDLSIIPEESSMLVISLSESKCSSKRRDLNVTKETSLMDKNHVSNNEPKYTHPKIVFAISFDEEVHCQLQRRDAIEERTTGSIRNSTTSRKCCTNRTIDNSSDEILELQTTNHRSLDSSELQVSPGRGEPDNDVRAMRSDSSTETGEGNEGRIVEDGFECIIGSQNINNEGGFTTSTPKTQTKRFGVFTRRENLKRLRKKIVIFQLGQQ